MSGISHFFTCLSGPTLYKMYRQAGRLGQGHHGTEKYAANAAERYGGIVMSCISTLWSFTIYTSPFILTTLYRREMFTPTGAVTLSKFFMSFCVVYVLSMNVRALGRATNPSYKEFLDVLTSALRDFKPENKQRLIPPPSTPWKPPLPVGPPPPLSESSGSLTPPPGMRKKVSK